MNRTSRLSFVKITKQYYQKRSGKQDPLFWEVGCGENDQYEKIISQGFSKIGNKIWLLAMTASGKMTTQSTLGICHPEGTRLVESTMIMNIRKPMMSASQKRRRMCRTSMKKLDHSTSFFIMHYMMLYKKRCVRSAWDR